MNRLAAAALLAAVLLGTRASAQTAEHLVVATPPIDSSGEVFYALEMGFFAKQGLDVKIVPMNNAGAIAPAVISGAVDIGGLTVPAVALAREKAVPLTIVAPGSVYSKAAPTSGIIVLKTSPLRLSWLRSCSVRARRLRPPANSSSPPRRSIRRAKSSTHWRWVFSPSKVST